MCDSVFNTNTEKCASKNFFFFFLISFWILNKKMLCNFKNGSLSVHICVCECLIWKIVNKFYTWVQWFANVKILYESTENQQKKKEIKTYLHTLQGKVLKWERKREENKL